MKNIIEKMYYGQLSGWERKRRWTENDEKSDKQLEHLYEAFSEEQKKLFEEFYNADGVVLSEKEAEGYELGFKTGFWLALELCDFSPDDNAK